jgi:hypothetical protein
MKKMLELFPVGHSDKACDCKPQFTCAGCGKLICPIHGCILPRKKDDARFVAGEFESAVYNAVG